MDFKATLNLPNPAFTIPMKADLPHREPEIQQYWKEINVYELIQKKRAGAKKFILHDGPPYTNSPIHMGTALNKSLKDFVVKYKTLRGFLAPYVPGYDNHGLPIEMAIQRKKGKKLSPDEMRKECRKHAEEYAEIQTKQFQRLAVFGEWEKPYKTMDYGYEATIVRAFAKLAEQGYIYRDLRPTHWSIYSQTALAETELIYEEHTSKAVYVRFPLLKDPKRIFVNFPSNRVYGLIWTTTPWTIPGNLALAFHPDLEYALVESEGDFYLLYSGLVEKVFEDIGIKPGNKVLTVKGRELEGVAFKHPIFNRESVGVLADYINTEEGTGVVHTAPGHGEEDFHTGKKYNLPILCPVNEAGVFTEEAGEFAGLHIHEADEIIPKRLAEEGNLLKVYDYRHNYPYSERDKHPVIFRTTEQWFLKVDHLDLRKRALEAISQVKWFPPSGRERITAMVSTRPDWCLSRQRIWGVGLPIVYGVPSGKPVLDSRIMERAAQIVEKGGSEAWFTAPIEEILPRDYRHPETGEREFRKETDVLDVWFDSGITHLAVLDWNYGNWENLESPADLYLEGSDQHRGWFNSSLITAMALCNHPPYRQVLTHGWVVDEKGRRMSKSLGNVVDPVEVANHHGADILRLWAASVDYTEDVSCSNKIIEQIGDVYRRIRNTFRFLLANLYDYSPNNTYSLVNPLDEWAVLQMRLLEKKCCDAYDVYDFREATSTLHNFCAREMSAFYLDAIKDRMYCDPADSPSRRSAQKACYEILMSLVKLIAPILPHTCEEVYRKIPSIDGKETVFLEVIEPIEDEEARRIENSSLFSRMKEFLRFKDRLYAELEAWKNTSGVKDMQDIYVKVYAPTESLKVLTTFGNELPTILRVSWLELLDSEEEKFEFAASEFAKCERCRLRRPDVENVNGVPLCKRDRALADSNLK